MKWSEIRKQYPDKFILIGDIVEERISENQSKVIEAKILEVADDGKEKMVTCETTEQFMDVMEVVTELLDPKRIKYADLALHEIKE